MKEAGLVERRNVPEAGCNTQAPQEIRREEYTKDRLGVQTAGYAGESASLQGSKQATPADLADAAKRHRTQAEYHEYHAREAKDTAEKLEAHALEARLTNLFSYHAPTEDDIPKYASINYRAKELATAIILTCPDGADKDYALLLVRMARMMANASIACKGQS